MSAHTAFLVVAAMAIVTYLPRMLPMVMLNRLRIPSFPRRMLKFMPYAVLGALIFPGVLDSTGNPATAVPGAIVAVLLALFRANLFIVVLGSIAAVYIAELLIG